MNSSRSNSKQKRRKQKELGKRKQARRKRVFIKESKKEGVDHFRECYKFCTGCELSKTRTKTALFSGQIPCDILFIGDAPDEFDDISGSPFAGPSGRLLAKLISKSLPEKSIRIAYSTLVSCMPVKDGSLCKPSKANIIACSSRLDSFIKLSEAKITVAVGPLAKKYFDYDYSIIDPEVILRAKEISGDKGLKIKATLNRLTSIFEELQNG